MIGNNNIEQAQALTTSLSESQNNLIAEGCNRIAPTWPLEELIAVNPWWELRDQSFLDVSAKIQALGQAHCLMPKTYFQNQWLETIYTHHVEQAMTELCHYEMTVMQLERYLLEDDDYTHWHNISDFVDSGRDRQHMMAWRDEITQQISQFCADYFRERPLNVCFNEHYSGIYSAWLETTRKDWGLEILMAEDGLTEQFLELPEKAEDLLAEAFGTLGVGDAQLADYIHALLLDENGWASWVAYLKWQDGLNGFDNTLMQEFLAIRVAWELVLWRHQKETGREVFNELKVMWRSQLSFLPRLIEAHKESQKKLWVWQRAAEIAYQSRLHERLRFTSEHLHPGIDESTGEVEHVTNPRTERSLVQAAFCIDVRSEVYRRALETQNEGIQTLGFAGFFGLPIEFQPLGSEISRPQLPGLLRSAIKVTPLTGKEKLTLTVEKLNKKARWSEWGYAPPATFSMVEATGVLYAFRMLKNSLFPDSHYHPINDLPLTAEFELTENEEPLNLERKAELAATILHAMGLDKNLASKVLLVGHGSRSCNNPHLAGYDCGACGGQTGEVNVRVLAYLLNEMDVREALVEKGIIIPEDTVFIAAMHNTTTDDITFFGEGVDDELRQWFENASDLCRQERSSRLGLTHLDGKALNKAIRGRSKDWSQVRPEWGLAGNAAFFVAPRWRTRGVDFDGRAFLHDYDHEEDQDRSLLTLIMTAPMVVANWINLQYYASACDNHVYGSGNKTLHNVIEGAVGVFEGNGGDLRIGLPIQALHDGENWMHEPLRLNVYIDAPREAIENIAKEHEAVRQLIDNDWLYLFRWGRKGTIERYYKGLWSTAYSTIQKTT
ncbi:YbcC family protein [Thiomicrorhabdus lithotrophica]|uniref:Probable inorganic carbon transporter subunit DabA n=1 Tax=Thiomicrorhabdus lithotrophica TaxID=2949997 RepID=A0ABY8CCQ2_9GAMM|nr:DUF2309 domain-containing protein [Thiomicrorhabdus lithotrophica]WEJ62445.1 DUF2309 domain-containing protein [Thiomicrorhabdus lithotrophica]